MSSSESYSLFSSAAFDQEVDYLDKLQSLNAHVNTSTGGYTSLPDWLLQDAGRLTTQAHEFLQAFKAGCSGVKTALLD